MDAEPAAPPPRRGRRPPPPDRGRSPLSPTGRTQLSPTGRTQLRRHRERGRADPADLFRVLDAGRVCHLGVVIDGAPAVLPTGYGRQGATLFLHGSSANRALIAADGAEVCVTVTHLDGLVCARSAFHCSVNYRSAMIFGVARLVAGREPKLAALRAITEQLIPGHWAAARPPSPKELAATSVLALPLAEASVKVRHGPPADEPEDHALGIWAGVVPAALTFGAPEPDPALAPGAPFPEHIRRLAPEPPAARRSACSG